MAEITLKCGAVALLDEADRVAFGSLGWTLSPSGYAVKDVRFGGTLYKYWLHRLILPPLPGLEPDHINGVRLDNRRRNLRLATRSQNLANSRIAPGSTGYRGVKLDKRDGRFNARIGVNGKPQHIGRYASAEEAARAYDAFAKEVFGDFATLNFPEHEIGRLESVYQPPEGAYATRARRYQDLASAPADLPTAPGRQV